jgi:DNA invertase Pin-like site-specific DNA recombinase
VVRSLDRIAGSETVAIQTISDLHERGVNIKSLTEPDIDTTTPTGRALFGIVAVFAQLRVDTIRDNTRRSLAHARAEGRIGGRPSVMTPERVEQALRMRADNHSIVHIAKVLGVGKSSVHRALDNAAE